MHLAVHNYSHDFYQKNGHENVLGHDHPKMGGTDHVRGHGKGEGNVLDCCFVVCICDYY